MNCYKSRIRSETSNVCYSRLEMGRPGKKVEKLRGKNRVFSGVFFSNGFEDKKEKHGGKTWFSTPFFSVSFSPGLPISIPDVVEQQLPVSSNTGQAS